MIGDEAAGLSVIGTWDAEGVEAGADVFVESLILFV